MGSRRTADLTRSTSPYQGEVRQTVLRSTFKTDAQESRHRVLDMENRAGAAEISSHSDPSSHSDSSSHDEAAFDETAFPVLARFRWPRFYGAALVFFCVALSWHALNADDDFWAHAAIGRWIWNHKSVPTHSLFLWSAEHFPWVAHSWLSQLSFYGLIQAGGGWTPRGDSSVGNGPFVVVVFTTLIVCVVWLLLWRLWNRQVKPNAFVLGLFALGVWAASLRYHARPELFTALFLTLLLCALVKRETRRIEYSKSEIALARSRWWREAIFFVVLFVLWANFHGAVALGFSIVAITALCDMLQNRFDARSRRFLLLACVCVLATGLVPFGARVYWSGVLSSTQSATFARISEWQPLLPLHDLKVFAAGGVAPELLPYALGDFVLALLALLSWNANPQRRWSQAAWIVFMGVLLLRQRRHIWLFALVCIAVMAANATFFETRALSRFGRERFGRERFGRKKRSQQLEDEQNVATTTGEKVAAIQSEVAIEKPLISPRLRPLLQLATLLCVTMIGVANASGDLWARRAVSPRLPDGACQIIERQAQILRARGQTLHLFNDYENSSYLQWRLNRPDERGYLPDRGRYPLFLDLLNAYPDSIVNRYVEILNATPEGQRLMQQNQINCVILNTSLRRGKLANYLNKNAQWAHIYNDKDGDVWARR